jgi:penicillin amidase
MRKALLLAVCVAAATGSVNAVQSGSVTGPAEVAGLTEPVEVLRDRWGVNHIYARNEADLFFVQGYTAARDRLFQFELWRRQATGTVAEILGRKELKRDIGTRLHMFRGDLKAELNWYHPRGDAIINAYVRGINAYIAEAVKNPSALPIEFKMLGITPAPWTPDVVISRHNGLLANIGQELNMAQAVRVLGAEKVKELQYFQGGDPDITPDPAIDLSLLNASILELYNAFRRPIAFGAEAPAEPSALELSQRVEDIGSNNWVVSGKLTQSGYPLMMNDPHRNQGAPSLRYWVHLVAPGWNVIGGGEPTLPGISIGHNEHGAWGLTIFGSDSEDLYVYETNPANPNQYKYRGAWEDMRIVKDTIRVKGEAAPVNVDLKFTRHGPVLSEDPAHRKAYALRAAWMEQGAAPYLASLRMDQAKTWEEFVAACTYSRIPSENMVWADRRGNIGYQAVAITPLRPNWSGLVPVPGDGRYEWNGYLPINALPHVANPEKGYFATANNYLFPPDYQYKEALHYTGSDPYRVSRISEVLGSGRLHTVADMMRLQNDNVSLPARSLVQLLRAPETPPASPAPVDKARSMLRAWNFSVDADSVAAGIYEMWQRRVAANVRNLVVPKEAQAFIGQPSMKRVIDWLNAPDGRFGADPPKGRDELLARSLDEAVAELTKKLGPDMNAWQWGQAKYHHALIRHPLAEMATPDVRATLNVGPYPRGGDSYTVSATGGADNQTSGGSLKIIADTENWDNSIGLNNPGQSGDPSSPHYRDLFEIWARGKYFPIFYTRPRIESVTEVRQTLTPRGASTAAPQGR